MSRPEWLEIAGFKDWLVLPENRRTTGCKVCNITFKTAKKSSLVEHARSAKHYKKLEMSEPPPIELFDNIPDKNFTNKRDITRAELQIIGVLNLLNIAFKVFPAILCLLKIVDPCGFWDLLCLGATKTRDVCVKVIGKYQKIRLTKIIREQKFSICIDEATDVSKNKALTIVVRYLDPCKLSIKNAVWEMAQVFVKKEAADGGAERIFQIIKDSFENHNVPLNNIISVCFDGCSTMTGWKNGLKAKLQKTVKNIICVTCPAHKTHLVAKHAMTMLPKEIQDFVTKVYTMMNSSNVHHDFANIQDALLLPSHKIFRWIKVRWLQLELCANRILEQWDAILRIAEIWSLKDTKAAAVLSVMRKNDSKCYIIMLQNVLKILNRLNRFFQKEEIIIHMVQDMVEKTYRSILLCYMNCNYVYSTPVSELDPLNEDQFLPFIDFHLGDEVRQNLLENGSDLEDFCSDALSFLVVICIEIKNR